MAWTTPLTRSTGYVVLATDWNSQVINNLLYLHGDAGAVTINNVLVPTGVDTVRLRAAKAALTYSSSITPNCLLGEWQTVTISNSTAFTINAPANAPASDQTQDLALEFVNNFNASSGAITFSSAGTGFAPLTANVPTNFTNPITTGKRQVAFFRWNGATWIGVNSTGLF